MKNRHTSYLSPAEAAKRMGITEGAVRDLCERGVLTSAIQRTKSGVWEIPLESIQTWLATQESRRAVEATSFAVLPHNGNAASPPRTPFADRVRKLAGALGTVVALLGIIGILADWKGAAEQVREWGRSVGIARDFSPAHSGETLILISTFYRTDGVADRDVHGEIQRAVERASKEADIPNVRVAIESGRLKADARDAAEQLGKRYNADMVIWGADTGVRVTVNFLNLRLPQADAASVTISETQRTEVADPDGYSTFVTDDLPRQLTFLSLFAVGQIFYSRHAFNDSASAIQRAVSELPDENIEGLAGAYYHLGWLSDHLQDSSDKAILEYTNLAFAHFSTGF